MAVPVPEATRRRVLDAAAALLGKDSGASLAEVAAAAHVGRTTVHRAFPTRQDLLRALALDAMDRVERAVGEALAAHPGDAPEPVLTRVADRLVPLADELRFLDLGAEIWDLPDLLERWYDLTRPMEDLVRRWQRSGALRPDLPVAWVVDLFVASVFAAASGVADGRVARRDVVGLVVDTLLHGAAAGGQP